MPGQRQGPCREKGVHMLDMSSRTHQDCNEECNIGPIQAASKDVVAVHGAFKRGESHEMLMLKEQIQCLLSVS